MYYIFSCGNDSHIGTRGRRNRLPTEPGSYNNTTDFVGENLLPNSSPVKSPPYSSAESDDNSFKGTGVLEREVIFQRLMMCVAIVSFCVFTREIIVLLFYFLFYFSGTSLQVPKSPRTPTSNRGMVHKIKHRFTKTFKMMTTCDYCEKQMFIGTGLKCKECKYICHRDCEPKVPHTCGLPQELFDEFKRTVQADGAYRLCLLQL